MNSFMYLFFDLIKMEEERIEREKHMVKLMLNIKANCPYEKDHLQSLVDGLSSHIDALYAPKGEKNSSESESEEKTVEKAMEFFGSI